LTTKMISSFPNKKKNLKKKKVKTDSLAMMKIYKR
jgi:hypothetical protein